MDKAARQGTSTFGADGAGAERQIAVLFATAPEGVRLGTLRFSPNLCIATAEYIVRNRTVVYNTRVTTMTVSEARAALPALLDRVIAGDEVTITRHGQPVAVVVRPDSLRSRRADASLASAERLRSLLAAGRRTSVTAAGLTETRAEALIAEVNAGRDRR